MYAMRVLIGQYPHGFPCLDTVIQTLEMLLDFRKAPALFCYVLRHPACYCAVFTRIP